MKKVICVLLSVFLILLSGCKSVEKPQKIEKITNFYVGSEALTLGAIAASSYAIGSTFGMNFDSPSLSHNGAQNFIETEINHYLRGRTITEVFGDEAIKAIAGKVVVGHVAYNAIVDFLKELNTKYNLGQNRATLGYMFGDNYCAMKGTIDLPALTGFSVEVIKGTNYWLGAWVGPDYKGSYYGDVYNSYEFDDLYYFMSGPNLFKCTMNFHNATSTRSYTMPDLYWSTIQSKTGLTRQNFYGSSTGDIGSAVVLNPGYGWAGDVNGYDTPDTNLDQMIGGIFDGVADTNLEVEGEVIPIDPPMPTPTLVPIDPGTPLQDVPWEGLDNNFQQLYEQGLEEIGTIGDARDAITDAVGEQTGALEGAIEDQTGALEGALADNAGVVSGAIDQAVSDVGNAIGTQTGTISGAIDQAVSDVQTAIGEQTAALDESLSATAEGVETIAEAIEDEAISWRKFDLKGLFPFCIPFDIYNMLNALDASPVAPHVQIPFVIQSLGFSYMIDLDFSAFDPVAAIMRQMELICYGLALAWATSKVIKW